LIAKTHFTLQSVEICNEASQSQCTRSKLQEGATAQAMLRVCLALLALFPSCFVFAQELEPRTYSPSPVGTTFLVVGFARSSGGVTFDPTVPVTDLQAKLNSPFLGLGTTFGLFGRQSLLTAALPYVWGHASGNVAEQQRLITRSGLANANFRFAFNIIGSPALKPKQFAAAKHQNFILAASLSVNTPTGQYDSTKLINLGTNRWSFKPEVGVSTPLTKKLSLDFYAAASFFTVNSSFFPGHSVRSQDALGSMQAHLSYAARRGLWIAFDSTWYGGGATHLNRGPATSRQSNSRVGGTVSLPIHKLQSVKLSYSSGLTARTGSSFDTLAISWQYVRLGQH
jgi:outer membrane putative beta-barrel porin/alpha-amylase